jgi:hypothetical protein
MNPMAILAQQHLFLLRKHANRTHPHYSLRCTHTGCQCRRMEFSLNLSGNMTQMVRRAHTDAHQLITDRFATSDDAALPCDTSQRKYCGGTWKGITNHLNYVQSMGFDAVWISPVVSNLEGNTSQGEAFHGSAHIVSVILIIAHAPFV